MISKNKVLNFVSYEMYRADVLDTIPLYKSSIKIILEERSFGYYVLGADDIRVVIGDRIINMFSRISADIVEIYNNMVRLINLDLNSKNYYNNLTTIETILNYSKKSYLILRKNDK